MPCAREVSEKVGHFVPAHYHEHGHSGGEQGEVCDSQPSQKPSLPWATCHRTVWLGVAQRSVSRSLDQLDQIVERGVVDLQALTQQAAGLGCPVRLVQRLVRRVDQRAGLEALSVERSQIDE